MEAEQRALQSSNENIATKNAFLTAISHEIRTPMNAIVGGLQVAQRYPHEDSASPLNIAQEGASEMMRLVNDILCYTEMQSGQLKNNEENVDVNVFLSQLKERYRPQCDQKGLRLEWMVEETVPRWLLLDQEKFDTVLSKLLDNAVRYTESGFVRLALRCEPLPGSASHRLVCGVADSGLGISSGDQAQMYDAFHQTQRGFQRRYGGLGIGLSICQQLLIVLGGELQLVSSSDKGSCFEITLPVNLGQAPVAEERGVLASAELPILVVEDNFVNQKVMKKMLEKLGYSSLIAAHGLEALEILNTKRCSLVLMDLQMPMMDGFSCSEAIRKLDDERKNIPIVAVTANLMDADKEHCISSGMNDFLKKPVRLDTLKESLSNHIEHVRSA